MDVQSGGQAHSVPHTTLMHQHPTPIHLQCACRFSVTVQVLFTLRCSRYCASMCASVLLAAPAAQRLTHRVALILSPVSIFTLNPCVPSVRDSPAECESVLLFLQMAVGCLGPLVWQAAVEAALFHGHQQQRLRAGIPLERGSSAALYEWVQALLHPVLRPHFCDG